MHAATLRISTGQFTGAQLPDDQCHATTGDTSKLLSIHRSGLAKNQILKSLEKTKQPLDR